jgi:hypothetical protein
MENMLVLLGVCWLLPVTVAQLSSPIASNSHVSVDGNKFLQRESDRFDTKWRCEHVMFSSWSYWAIPLWHGWKRSAWHGQNSMLTQCSSAGCLNQVAAMMSRTSPGTSECVQ